MINLHLVLYGAALVGFLLAGFPHLTAPTTIRWEWLAVAALTLTLIV